MNPRGDSLKTVAGEISEITDQMKPKGDKFQTVAGGKETQSFPADKFLFPCPRSNYNSNYTPHLFQQTF